MKKVVSLILALTLVFAMSTSALAVTKRVVGVTSPTGTSYEDGWTETEFEQNQSGTVNNTVEISVTSTATEHRYAVDVVYEAITVEITGATLTWDVNSLEYVAKPGTGTLTKPVDKTITVKNYSDMPVYIAAEVIDAYTDDNMAITVAYDEEIAAVLAGADDGNAETITVSFNTPNNTTEEWAAVAAYYAAVLGADASKQIATINISISKNP